MTIQTFTAPAPLTVSVLPARFASLTPDEVRVKKAHDGPQLAQRSRRR